MRAACMLTICLGGGLCRRCAEATFSTRQLTPETAEAAQGALTRCRANGYQVGVAVVDRAGILQVLLRDRFAGPLAPLAAFSPPG